MLILPFLSDLLLLDHHSIGLLFVSLVSLLGLQQDILKVGNLYIGFISKLIYSAMGYDLLSIQL